MSTVSQNIDRVDVVFDEPNLVANAGLISGGHIGGPLGLGAADRPNGEAGGPEPVERTRAGRS